MVLLVILQGKLYINIVSISAEKHFFSFFSTVGVSAISFLNKLQISLCTAFSIRTYDCPMAMFLFFACSAIVICSDILVDFKIFFQSFGMASRSDI